VTFDGHFWYRTINCFIVLFKVYYNGWTPYVSNYFYCSIRPEVLLYDAEHDLLAIAKFLVCVS